MIDTVLTEVKIGKGTICDGNVKIGAVRKVKCRRGEVHKDLWKLLVSCCAFDCVDSLAYSVMEKSVEVLVSFFNEVGINEVNQFHASLETGFAGSLLNVLYTLAYILYLIQQKLE